MTIKNNAIKCKMCLKFGLTEFKSFSKLKRVTSDCKPFEKGGRLFICNNCGGVQKTSDNKWLKEITSIYKNYDTFSLPGFTDQVIIDTASQTLLPRCSTLLRYLKKVINIDKNSSWLDYGCGRGAMLNAASEICDNLYGYDLDNSHVSYLSKIKNFKKLYTVNQREKLKNFSIVSMIHSLEHFVDPYDELVNAYNILSENGILFIQVNDTRLNPFEILVADHLTHFEPYTLSEMLKKVGFKVEFVTNNWVTKEISLVAIKNNEQSNVFAVSSRLTHNLEEIINQVDWLNDLAENGRELAKNNKNFGLFGSAVASTWLAEEIGDNVSFFVDEDVDRIGKKHMEKPIIDPKKLKKDQTVYIGLIPVIAIKIEKKLRYIGAQFKLPPEINDDKIIPYFAANVWGKSYIDNFCNFTLPMHISSGNLPKIASEVSVKYVIFTSVEDMIYFESKEIINELRKFAEVEFLGLKIDKKNKYFLISELQNKGMDLAKRDGYDCFFPLYADVLCSDGTLYNSYLKIKEGNDAVVSLGPQTILANMEKEILKSGKFHENKFAVKISSRQLVDITFKNLHPFHAPSFWEKDNFTTTPSMIFFRGPNKNVLAHGFHLHPVVFRLPENLALYKPFHGTLDENFMSVMFESSDNVYISQDSDEVFMCSLEALEGGDARGASTDGNPNVAKVARFAERHTFMLQREFIKVPIRLHSSDIKESDWYNVEKKANFIINKVLNRLYTPDSILKLEDPVAYANRQYHLEQVKISEKALLRMVFPVHQYFEPVLEIKKEPVPEIKKAVILKKKKSLYRIKKIKHISYSYGFTRVLVHILLRIIDSFITIGKLKRLYLFLVKIYLFIFRKKMKLRNINKKGLIAFVRDNFVDRELRKYPTGSLLKYTLKCLILIKTP